MEEKQANYKKVIRMFKNRYIIAMVVLVLIIIARQAIITYVMHHNDHMASVINIAGRQRMLSQRIAKNILAIYELGDEEAVQEYIKDLKETVQICETRQIALQYGDSIEGEPLTNSRAVTELYTRIEGNHHAIITASKEIITMMESDKYDKVSFKEKMYIILEHEEIYLEGMERIVNQYDEEARDKEYQLEQLEFILFVILLVVVAFEVVAVFLPTHKTLISAVEDITESSASLLTLIQSVNEEIFLINVDSFEIIFSNEKAQQLMDIEPDGKKRYLTDEIVWGDESSFDITRMIREEERNEGIEASIIKKSGEIRYYKISTVKGIYNRTNAILIVLADITSQKRDEEIVRKQAIKDELTGLYNRHFLDEIVAEELDRADRYNFPLSIFIMDIDFFKRVNDTWGHPVGDIILKHTAELTLKNIRRSDFFIRFGGEEFLLFMPHIDLKHAVQAAEKVRKEIENFIHPVVGKYTASFGVAERKKSESFESLYQRADAALYRAKQEGRNRVIADAQQELIHSDVLHITWREEWNSGNAIIDNQHKDLLIMINEIANLNLSDVSEKAIKDKMNIIIRHIEKHFETEEKILQQIGYPYYKNHANVHTNLLICIKELEEEYMAGKVKLTAFFSFLLDEIVVSHILDMDTKFFTYVKEYPGV